MYAVYKKNEFNWSTFTLCRSGFAFFSTIYSLLSIKINNTNKDNNKTDKTNYATQVSTTAAQH